MQQERLEKAKKKLQQLFKFLAEFHRLREVPALNISSYPWKLSLQDLPESGSITIGESEYLGSSTDDSESFLLKVVRANETPCPRPPDSIAEWLKRGWQDASGSPETQLYQNHADDDGKTWIENFHDSSVREEDFSQWKREREKWCLAEAPVREANAVFSDLFELWGSLQRESEKFQLYVADGFLRLAHPDGDIEHPILLHKIDLIFDAKIPEFKFVNGEDDPVLYSPLFRLLNIGGDNLSEAKKLLDEHPYHPLSGDMTTSFLKFLAQRFWRNGEFRTETPSGSATEQPIIFRRPILFVGPRNQGYAEMLDGLVLALPELGMVPESLARIVGVDLNADDSKEKSGDEPLAKTDNREKVEILFTKPSNPEQERIIERLETFGSVLVQGPPGTGKSHTIANIVGHLLAQNKTVLITSHTSKALKVVKAKVVDNLKPLCVSVLGSDEESRRELEQSVSGIVTYLTKTDSATLNAEIGVLAEKREMLKQRMAETKRLLLSAQSDEYRDIVVGGESIHPAKAARETRQNADRDGWIPRPLKTVGPLPLAEEDFIELYRSNSLLTLDDEECLSQEIPAVARLRGTEEFRSSAERLQELEHLDLSSNNDSWFHANQTPEMFARTTDALHVALKDLASDQKWVIECIDAGYKGAPTDEVWRALSTSIAETNEWFNQSRNLLLENGPELSPDFSFEDNERICDAIIGHLSAGKSLGIATSIFNQEWMKLRKGSKVDSGSPTSIAHFKSLKALAKLRRLRANLKKRWERLVVPNGGASLEGIEAVETKLSLISEQIQSLLMWHETAWKPALKSFGELGLDWERVRIRGHQSADLNLELERVIFILKNVLPEMVHQRKLFVEHMAINLRNQADLDYLMPFNHGAVKPLLTDFIQAIASGDVERYLRCWTRLHDLNQKQSLFTRKVGLLSALAKSAPIWSSEIKLRRGLHGEDKLPGNARNAWMHAQWQQELEERGKHDLDSLQKSLSELNDEIQKVTASLVEKRAWLGQIERTTLDQQQALNGWVTIQKRIGAGTGKRVPLLREEARRTLKECKNAVPVWIMPISRVVENFDLTKTKFDVVILDEASQSDMQSLSVLAIADKAIVVGDDEQVSPSAIGQDLDKVQVLIEEYLKDIPNKIQFDGRLSIYNLAEQAFGGTIRLVEHFRCVPDIIQFSNHLCYNGDIKPLREDSSTDIKPPTVAHRVQATSSDGKVNLVEATEIASLIAAMTEHDRYSKATVGVISLLGAEQAFEIEKILRHRLPIAEYTRRNIICGTAAQFQGDERDVMFVSVVSTNSEEGPLRVMRDGEFRKRMNVAASRAQNQLWVVHSLNPETDLKQDDLRLRLIQHCQNPHALSTEIESVSATADSEFEKLVIEGLVREGFKVHSQWKVGAYRIDLVVQGSSRRIAIECDGDRYHPPEKMGEDLARQMVLERLGWKFIRIRGSEFFRYPAETLARVIRRLEELGIDRLSLSGPAPLAGYDSCVEELVRRATEIRTNWEQDPIVQTENTGEPKGKRKNHASRKRTA